ncbi:MAG: hypothetical protein ABIJ09_15650 [Pseudomonadota bacterium]
MRTRSLVVAWVLLGSLGCAGPSLEQRRQSALPAIQTLQTGEWVEAEQESARVLQEDTDNPFALVVDAITRYKRTMHQLVADLIGVAATVEVAGTLNQKYLSFTLDTAEAELARIDDDLARASRCADFNMDLCLACWEYDWNHSGEVDDFDRRLFEVELDHDGQPYPEGDPRRRPTFRFDRGDLLWARAFLSFQRAALHLAQAYDASGALQTLQSENEPSRIVFRLTDATRITRARQLILDGLDLTEKARQAYLAESDDEREWLPNPRQKDHPLPMPVDEVLYQTWGAILVDTTALVKGETVLRVADLIELADERAEPMPAGSIDLGGFLSKPRDIVLDIQALDRAEDNDDIEGALRLVLGDWYVTGRPPSTLTMQLRRMKSEVDRGDESIERKLRYVLWLN